MSTAKSYQQEVGKILAKWKSWPSKVVVNDTALDTKESIATDIKCDAGDDRMKKLGVAFWSSWPKLPAGFTP